MNTLEWTPSVESSVAGPPNPGTEASPGLVPEISLKLTAFDKRHYQALIRAREETIRTVVRRLTRLRR